MIFLLFSARPDDPTRPPTVSYLPMGGGGYRFGVRRQQAFFIGVRVQKKFLIGVRVWRPRPNILISGVLLTFFDIFVIFCY